MRLIEKDLEFGDHIYVRRGRIYNQISGSELIKKTQELLNTRNGNWRSTISKVYETVQIFVASAATS